MKPFQQLLVSSAALGLVAPMAVLASETDLNRYAPVTSDQITNISQFGDVQPTDWAYQALNNLVEQYGCVAGYPNGTFKGAKPLSRFEAAALLNSCLDRVTEATDELKRLAEEFQRELAVIRGRIDGIEKKIGKLEAAQFSTTTKLQGESTFVIGAVSFGGSQYGPSTANGAGATTPNNGTTNATRYSGNNNRNWGALSFNYDLRLNLNTSFTGKDLLYTRLRAGNFQNSVFNGQPYSLLALDKAYFTNTGSTGNGNNVVGIDRLYYRFPVGKEFTAVIGPRARNTEALAITPTFYRADLLDVFTLNGAPATYNKATGAAFALIWKQQVKKGQPFLAASTSYVAPNGDNSNPAAGGIATSGSGGSFLTQIGWAGPQFALTAAWRYGQCNQGLTRRGTQFANQNLPCSEGVGTSGVSPFWSGNSTSNNFAFNAAWQPIKSGLIPSLSLGYGISAISSANFNGYNASSVVPVNGNTQPFPNYGDVRNITQLQSWQLGLQWNDLFAKGNAAGFAFGQPTYVSALSQNRIRKPYAFQGSGRNRAQTAYNGFYDSPNGPNDGNFAFEWWYKFQVSNNISITPAIFYLSRPNGQFTANGETNNAFGGLVQTQFRF
ncbi:porin [Cyanobium sp.]|nr:porin [Cyanobium sp.]